MPLLPSHPPGGHRNTEGSTPHYPPQPTPAAPHRIASHRIEVLLLHPQIGSDLLGAHLGIKDRQLGAFVQQVAADADGGGLATAMRLPVTVPNSPLQPGR